VKKITPKKVVKKVAPKKPAKKVVKKAVKKVAPKKPAKKVVKKIVKKVAPKKPAKKAVAKKVVKKVVKKVTPKKPAKKVVAKKVVKKVVKKVAPKKPAKKVIVKKVTKPLTKKAVKPLKKVTKPISKKLVMPITKKAIPLKNSKKIVEAKPVVVAKKPEVVKHVTITIDKTIEERKPTPSKNIIFPSSNNEVAAEVIESKRYSDVDLAEFKELINKKLVVAREELANLINQMQNPGLNASAETDNSYKTLEDGASTAEKEYISQLAVRQRKFIENLDNALIRIENKTYGICRVTGKLISKDRLRAVPHTTLSMEAKLQQYK